MVLHTLVVDPLQSGRGLGSAFVRFYEAYALEQGTFDQKVFYEAFGIFDNQSIEKSLVSENPLVRIFALLDRRLGKRRLLALEDSMEQELDWVRAFYVIRLQAEGLMEANNI